MGDAAVRLDRRQPPPGFSPMLAGGRLALRTPQGSLVADLEAAWATHEEQNDPPGINVIWEPDDEHFDPNGPGEWHVEVPTSGPTCVIWWRSYPVSDVGKSEARDAAWAHYWSRLRLADNIDRCALACVFPILKAHDGGAWPFALSWSDAEAESVARWLADTHKVPIPEVLHG